MARRKPEQFIPIDRADMDAISPCGHYMRFRLPCVDEDGRESMACMQCGCESAQDRAEAAEAERDAACARLARLNRFDLAFAKALGRYDLDAASGTICEFSEGRYVLRAAVLALFK